MQVYQANWSWGEVTDKWLQSLCIGQTLNFPCGMSQVGNIRADIDPTVKPDIIADLREPQKHFKPLTFDTVLCDPPYSMYNKFLWITKLSELTRKRIIMATPLVSLYLGKKNWKKTIYIVDQGKKFFRVFQVFDRLNGQL